MCTRRTSVANLNRGNAEKRDEENERTSEGWGRKSQRNLTSIWANISHELTYPLFPYLSLSLGVVGTSKATCLYRLFPFRTFWQKQARWHQPQKHSQFLKQTSKQSTQFYVSHVNTHKTWQVHSHSLAKHQR